MKLIVILASIILGSIIGFLPKLHVPKPSWWKILTISSLLLASFFTLFPPLAGSFSNMELMRNINNHYSQPTLVKVLECQEDINTQAFINVIAEDDNAVKQTVKLDKSLGNLEINSQYILDLTYSDDVNTFECSNIVSTNPILTFPLIIGLEEKIRIINFHVPLAWVSVLAYLISMYFSIQYLRNKDINNDIILASTAKLGTIFAILATLTGMIWAKFNWGSFWSWDPRQTSIFVLLLIYAAFFALRSSISSKDLRAKLSAVYSILASITVPFFVFILPRLSVGLHPGSDGNGPIIGSNQGMLDSSILIGFAFAMLAFTLLFFWIINLDIRYEFLKINQEAENE